MLLFTSFDIEQRVLCPWADKVPAQGVFAFQFKVLLKNILAPGILLVDVAIDFASIGRFDQALVGDIPGRIQTDEQMRFVRVNRLDPDSMHRFFSVLFDIIDHRSMAACVLYTIPVLSMDLRLYDSEMKQRYQHRWLSGLEEAGILGMDAELLMANCMSIVTNVCYRYVRGDIARDRAVNQVCQMVAANVVAAHHSTKS